MDGNNACSCRFKRSKYICSISRTLYLKHVTVTSWLIKLFVFRWRNNPSEKSTSTCTFTLSSSSYSDPSSPSISSSVSLLTISISRRERWVLFDTNFRHYLCRICKFFCERWTQLISYQAQSQVITQSWISDVLHFLNFRENQILVFLWKYWLIRHFLLVTDRFFLPFFSIKIMLAVSAFT